ncbi:aldolase/citrate lyase family protein [Massilia sp. SYSU DXS3249]
MQVPSNHFKNALRKGEMQLGLWSGLSSHVTVELLANAGFDWLLLDTEHSPNELPMVHCQLQAIARGTTHPIVRPPWNDTVTIKRYLDIGVQTLLIPYVENADEARQAVAATRYPPLGVRGYAAAARASDFGRIKDYPGTCEEQLCLLVQVETPAALANIEAIAAVDGVDGIFVGPGDLAASMGFIGQVGHPEVVAAIDDAIRRIRACGKPAGILAGDERLARHWIEAGANFVAVGSDTGLLARGAEQLAAKFRNAA